MGLLSLRFAIWLCILPAYLPSLGTARDRLPQRRKEESERFYPIRNLFQLHLVKNLSDDGRMDAL